VAPGGPEGARLLLPRVLDLDQGEGALGGEGAADLAGPGVLARDVMPEAYDAALKDARPGQVVGPFATEGGFALVKVEDRRLEQPITLEAARPQIVRFLTYDQIRDLLEKLRGRAKVEVLVKGDGARPVPPADAPKAAPQPKTQTPTQTPPAKGAQP